MCRNITIGILKNYSKENWVLFFPFNIFLGSNLQGLSDDIYQDLESDFYTFRIDHVKKCFPSIAFS